MQQSARRFDEGVLGRARCRGGLVRRRGYGGFYTGTKGETLETASSCSTDYRASSRPYQAPQLLLSRGVMETLDRSALRWDIAVG